MKMMLQYFRKVRFGNQFRWIISKQQVIFLSHCCLSSEGECSECYTKLYATRRMSLISSAMFYLDGSLR